MRDPAHHPKIEPVNANAKQLRVQRTILLEPHSGLKPRTEAALNFDLAHSALVHGLDSLDKLLRNPNARLNVPELVPRHSVISLTEVLQTYMQRVTEGLSPLKKMPH